MSTSRKRASIVAAAILAAMLGFGSAMAINRQSPVFGVTLPPGYRDWRAIGVAHEAGSLNDIRVILGNDVAVEAFRKGTRPFPEGTQIVRLAWRLVPSARNNAIFGQPQSFVTGEPTNVQVEIKDSKRFASTNGWGYGQFEGGVPNPSEALMRTCHACHVRLPAKDDLIFTHYSR